MRPPNSLLPSLRSNKDEGQANFVNPGILLVNAGTNLELTPKLRAFVNVNYLKFERTEPLELLLSKPPSATPSAGTPVSASAIAPR